MPPRFNYSNGGQTLGVPSGFNDPNSMAMGQYLLSGNQQASLDPSMQQFLATMFQYPLTSKGQPEPYDVDTQNKLQNALQDRQQSLFNMGNSMMTGGLAPSAYNPTRKEKQLDFPETGTLSVLAQSQGLEGTLAGLILGGQTASQAMLTVQDMIANPAANEMTDAEAAALQRALPTLPPDQFGKAQGPDWDALTKMADSMAKPYYAEQGIKARAQDPSSGVMERNGKYYQVEESPSAATQFLADQGLDNPNAQYDSDYLRNTSPDFGGIEQFLGQSMGDLDAARATYKGNDVERQRQAALRDKYMTADQAAMDRYSRDVQSGMQDYGQAINRDMVRTPGWAGGQFVGDPTVEPQLGQRTGTQNDRDARLNEAMTYFRNYGAEGRIGSTPESIRQALADYMSSASREPMTNVPGSAGSVMVGGAGRGPGGGGGGGGPAPLVNNLPGYINSQASPGATPQQGSPVRAGVALDPTLPELPQLSGYSDPEQAQREAMAVQLLGQLPGIGGTLLGGMSKGLQARGEQAGRLIPKAVPSKQVDATRRKIAYDKTHAAQLAYARAMLPMLVAQRAGRTPFQDEIQARSQSMYGVGSIG